MTFVLSLSSAETIWMVADRRLNYASMPPRDDACKLLLLETVDSNAILGYAGLGETVGGVEPSSWMSAVLRGRSGPLAPTLYLLAFVLAREIPPHLLKLNPSSLGEHDIITVALCAERRPRLHFTEVTIPADTRQFTMRQRQVRPDSVRDETRIAIAGSGQRHVLQFERAQLRQLLGLAKAHGQGRISALAVADALAALSYRVHRGTGDGTVGSRSIVAWRHRKDGAHQGGGGHQFYSDIRRDDSSPAIPTIAHGMDMQDVFRQLHPAVEEMAARAARGDFDAATEVNFPSELHHMPPDETLR